MKTDESKMQTQLTELYVNELVFYTKCDISLFGFTYKEGRFHETEFVISRNDLRLLMSGAGKQGIEILWRIEHLFLHPHAVPAGLNLVDMFGTTQIFKAHSIQLENPLNDDDGVLDPETNQKIYFIEEVVLHAGPKPSLNSYNV